MHNKKGAYENMKRGFGKWWGSLKYWQKGAIVGVAGGLVSGLIALWTSKIPFSKINIKVLFAILFSLIISILPYLFIGVIIGLIIDKIKKAQERRQVTKKEKQKISGYATASFVLGIVGAVVLVGFILELISVTYFPGRLITQLFSLFFLFPLELLLLALLLSITFGIIAFSKISKNPLLRGKRFAVLGVLFGVLVLIITPFVLLKLSEPLSPPPQYTECEPPPQFKVNDICVENGKLKIDVENVGQQDIDKFRVDMHAEEFSNMTYATYMTYTTSLKSLSSNTFTLDLPKEYKEIHFRTIMLIPWVTYENVTTECLEQIYVQTFEAVKGHIKNC